MYSVKHEFNVSHGQWAGGGGGGEGRGEECTLTVPFWKVEKLCCVALHD